MRLRRAMAGLCATAGLTFAVPTGAQASAAPVPAPTPGSPVGVQGPPAVSARDMTPGAVAARARSRSLYSGQGPASAVQTVRAKLPELVNVPAWTPLAIPS